MRRFAIMMCGGAALFVSPALSQVPLNPGQIETLIEKVLSEKPELVLNAIGRAEARAKAETDARVGAAAQKVLRRAELRSSSMPVLGIRQAPATIVEAVDYRCSFCRLMHPRVKELLARRSDVRVVILMTPVLGEESEKIARFALAADAQGRFEAVHDALFSTSGSPSSEDGFLKAIAEQAGVDWAKAKDAMASPAVSEAMEQARRDWLSLEAPGTPFVITGGRTIQGAVSTQELLDALTA